MPNKLVGLRTSIGKTQADFAEMLGITQGTYSKKEKLDWEIDFTRSEMKILLNYLKGFFPDLTAEELFFN